MMGTVKQTQTKETSGKQSSSDRNEPLKREDEFLGKQEEMVLLKTLDCTTKEKCSMKNWELEQMKCSDKYPNHGTLQHKIIKREANEDSNMTNAESDANKRPWKNLTAQRMWNWPETLVEDDGWQNFR